LNGLIDYAGSHFKVEERYFTRFGYADAEAHKKAHADFVARVLDLKARFDAKTVGLSMEVMSFLSDWLQGHIKGVDKKYGGNGLENALSFGRADALTSVSTLL